MVSSVVSLSKSVGAAKPKGKTRNPLAARPKKRSSGGGGGGGDSRLVTLSMKESDIIKALATHKPIYVSCPAREPATKFCEPGPSIT